MSIVACVTTRNEKSTIIDLVHSLHQYVNRVVVVDADSSDGTAVLARAAGATVIQLPTKLAIGPSLMIAWQHALEAERVVQIDAGGSHDPQDIPTLLKETSDIVIGSRFTEGGRYHGGRAWRSAGSRVAAHLCSVATGVTIADWTSGFRVFDQKAIRFLARQTYQAKMHGWQIEVLGKALNQGLTVTEAPITYTAGRSSFNLSTVREVYSTWLRLHV